MALEEFLIAESALENSSPQEEQIMHEGISTSKVSASLLQGNMVPINNIIVFREEEAVLKPTSGSSLVTSLA